jgi:aldehyde dehydrogenase (NAD+)
MGFQQVLVDGEWIGAANGDTIPVFGPSDGSEIARIARGTSADIDRAVKAARNAFEGVWGATAAVDRGRLLTKLGQLILDHFDELAGIEARDTGKPMKQARNDIAACARYFEFYGGAADKIHGDTIPFLTGYQVMILREPRGVTGHIIPWNYPAQMFGRTIGASLAAGNAAVMKPAEEACLSVLRLAELALEAGIPPGAINIVTGLGEEAGAALSAHPDVDLISFTGSPDVGTLVQQAAAVHHVPCVLELGGKSPQIVFDDADQEKAAQVITNAIVQNAGQTCSAGSRVLVQRSIYDRFLGLLGERFARLKVGPHDLDLDCGPVITAKQKQRVEGFFKAAARHIDAIASGTSTTGAAKGFSCRRPSTRWCRRRTRWRRKRCSARCWRPSPSTTRATPSASPTAPNTGWFRRLDRERRAPDAHGGACAPARCSSTAMAPAAASNCPSAASARPVTARKGSRRCANSPWRSTVVFNHG